MAHEETKDFNAMLHKDNGMPRIQRITDPASIQKYGGDKMYLAPPLAYDHLMKTIPRGQVVTLGEIRAYLARTGGGGFTHPPTGGTFLYPAPRVRGPRTRDQNPHRRTPHAGGELNPKYPGGIETQKAKLEAEGHTILSKGRKNIRYYVKDYEKALFALE